MTLEQVKEKLILVAAWFLIGSFVMAGMRLMEWVIPKPDIRVLVCTSDELGKVEICKTLEELRAKQGG